MLRRVLAPIALLLTIGCGSDEGPESEPGPTAEVRLLHGAADATSLDLLVGSTVVLKGVEFRHTSEFVEAPAGARTIGVRKSGNSALLRTTDVTLTEGARYSVVAGGVVLSVAPVSTALDTGSVKTDRANLRIINVASTPDSGNTAPQDLLDVHITAPGTDLAGHNPQLTLDAWYSSYSTLLYFDPGNWVVRFTRAGTSTVVASSESIAIAAGQVRAFVLEKLSGGIYRLTVVTE
jgi:hypothetical protein